MIDSNPPDLSLNVTGSCQLGALCMCCSCQHIDGVEIRVLLQLSPRG